MKTRYVSLSIFIVFLFLLTSCVSAEVRLNKKFETLPEVESILLYESSSIYSGATGRCKGTFMDRWYGTEQDAETISKLYSDAFSEKGWTIWPEDVVEIWSVESDNGLYRAGLDVFAEPTSVSQEQASYRLPDSVFREFSHYRTVYLISMTYRSSSVAKRCFGK